MASEMGVPFLGRVPLDPQVVASGDAGRPFAADTPASATAVAFAGIVARLLDDPPAPQESPVMKIALPTADGQLCMHFGHCDRFAVVTVAHGKIQATEFLEPPAHEPGALPRWLHEQGVDVIIAGGMGQRAQTFFAEFGIDVVVGAQPGDPPKIVRAYLDGALATGANICDH